MLSGNAEIIVRSTRNNDSACLNNFLYILFDFAGFELKFKLFIYAFSPFSKNKN